MKRATYWVNRYDLYSSPRFVAMAAYENTLLVTGSHDSYTGARTELTKLANKAGLRLYWFVGEQCFDGDNQAQSWDEVYP